MAYERMNLQDFDQDNPFAAKHVDHLEDGIVDVEGEATTAQEAVSTEAESREKADDELSEKIQANTDLIDSSLGGTTFKTGDINGAGGSIDFTASRAIIFAYFTGSNNGALYCCSGSYVSILVSNSNLECTASSNTYTLTATGGSSSSRIRYFVITF